jgi:hypothetical protein
VILGRGSFYDCHQHTGCLSNSFLELRKYLNYNWLNCFVID